MNNNTEPHPIELLLLALWLAAEALAALIAELIAPPPTAPPALALPAAPPRPLALPPSPEPAPPLAALTVGELRHLARSAGLRSLARSGRRADLLEALAATG